MPGANVRRRGTGDPEATLETEAKRLYFSFAGFFWAKSQVRAAGSR